MTDNNDRTLNPSETLEAPRIAIVGLGPVGMILAAHLQEAGCTLAVCDNDKVKINLIRKDGIRLEGVMSKKVHCDQLYSNIRDLPEFRPTIVIVAIKAYQTQAFVSQVLKLDFPDAVFISAQNGIDVEQIQVAGLGESKVLRMVVNFAGVLNQPNVAKVTFFNPPNYLASLDDSRTDIAQQFADILNKCHLNTTVVSSFEIIKRSWEKTILNASLSALCGIGKLTIKEAMEIGDTLEIIEQVIMEAVEVAETEKIKFEDDFIRKCLRYLRKAGDHFPSLAVDLINNRPTEIDFMNGKIVEYGRKHYIRTPLNLSMTNMVKAMTFKSASAFMKTLDPSLVGKKMMAENKGKMVNGIVINGGAKGSKYYLGIDLGSSFTKFIVLDKNNQVVFKTALKTLNRDKIGVRHVMTALKSEFNIMASCVTGYGRKNFPDADFAKTEINCAAEGVSFFYSGSKNIIDIGGEDIKVIRCGDDNAVENFYMNDKCAAGTGSFITEIAERAEISVSEMSILAEHSPTQKELNSFCTVFAKTEIMKWLIEGMSVEDIAKGVYLSIANRVAKLRTDPEHRILMIGGVIQYHPYLKTILEERLNQPIMVVENPQFMAAFGAALMARRHYQQRKKTASEEQKIAAT